MTTIDPSLGPEDIAYQFGIFPLPPPLADKKDAKDALICLKYLFTRFNTIENHEAEIAPQRITGDRRRAMKNEIRCEIAPAAILLAIYLRVLGMPCLNNDGDDKDKDKLAFSFVCRLDQILKAFKNNPAVTDMMRQYSFDVDHQSATKVPTTKLGLPQLRAALATNFCPLNTSHQAPLDLEMTDKAHNEAELAVVQWKAVHFFLTWCEENGRSGYDLVLSREVKNHELKLITMKRDLEAILHLRRS